MINKEMKESIWENIRAIRTGFVSIKINHFIVGRTMVNIRDTFTSGFFTYQDKCFIYTEWLKLICTVFDLKEAQVYQYIRVYEFFGEDSNYKEYGLTQLFELLVLDKEQLKLLEDLSPTLSVKKIRLMVQEFLKSKVPVKMHGINSEPEEEEDDNAATDKQSDYEQMTTYNTLVRNQIHNEVDFFQAKLVDLQARILASPKNMILKGRNVQLKKDLARVEKLEENLLNELKRYLS